MGKPGVSRGLLVLALAVAAAVAASLVASAHQQRTRFAVRFDPHKEAKFEHARGEEASRNGADNPVAEQVADRAYPRSYVDDRLALKSRDAFKTKPDILGPSAFLTAGAFSAAEAASPGAWRALGPVTPNVAGEASQFYDPATGTGPPTQESGRVTALAIDPNCGKASAPAALCPVAAAGGGIWRTNNALAAKPAWIAPPASLPTNAFGSLVVDANDASGDTLYAGSGEPNGSGDSEAGLGLFKSTDGGQSWSLVAGSQSVAINRSIGAIAIKPAARHDLHRHGRRPPRLLGGQRRSPDAAERPGARRLQVDGRRRDVHARDRPRDEDPAEPRARIVGRRLVPGRHHEAGARPEQRGRDLRRGRRLRSLALERRRLRAGRRSSRR